VKLTLALATLKVLMPSAPLAVLTPQSSWPPPVAEAAALAACASCPEPSAAPPPLASVLQPLLFIEPTACTSCPPLGNSASASSPPPGCTAKAVMKAATPSGTDDSCAPLSRLKAISACAASPGVPQRRYSTPAAASTADTPAWSAAPHAPPTGVPSAATAGVEPDTVVRRTLPAPDGCSCSAAAALLLIQTPAGTAAGSDAADVRLAAPPLLTVSMLSWPLEPSDSANSAAPEASRPALQASSLVPGGATTTPPYDTPEALSSSTGGVCAHVRLSSASARRTRRIQRLALLPSRERSRPCLVAPSASAGASSSHAAARVQHVSERNPLPLLPICALPRLCTSAVVPGGTASELASAH
jgi:hypothetical protein